MNFQECLAYLEHVQSLGIKLGLDNVRGLLAALGDPQTEFPSVIVAGSNGKGSVCAMLTRMTTVQGYRTGLYTSPHLMEYEERIRIGEDLISRADFCRILGRIREDIDRLLATGDLVRHPTHFEILTCLALLHFRESKVDLAVLEVGMGGRFDAVNAVEPMLGVITTISLEHQRFLGGTLAEIAEEKAGIIRPGIPLVSGVESSPAAEAIRVRAQAAGAPLIEVFAPERGFRRIPDSRGTAFEYRSGGRRLSLTPSLPGLHQGRNAAVAAAAALELDRLWNRLDDESIIRGAATTRWEGRMEIVSRSPLILLDGAHNPAGARALRAYLEEVAPRPLVLIFAVMRDKPIGLLSEILFPKAERIILTRFPYHRAASPEEIAAAARTGCERIRLEPNPARALEQAIAAAGTGGCVVAAGSLFLIGEIKSILEPRGAPVAAT